MSLAWPWVFLLAPAPWLVWIGLRPIAVAALRVPRIDAAPGVPGRAGIPGRRWGLAFAAWLLLLVAAARPQIIDTTQARPVSGRDLMFALDLSVSMGTRDMTFGTRPLDRLAAARLLAAQFLETRRGDRVGLIVFGDKAYLHTPLSFDLEAVRAALDSVGVGLAGRETAIGDAIALAARQLGQAELRGERVLILITDGAQTAGALSTGQAAWIAQREGVRIHAAGIGSEASGRGRAFDLDEAALRAIATQTGGSYTRATDGNGLAGFFSAIAAREPAITTATTRPTRELYPWPLAAAMLLAAALLLPLRRNAR